MSMLDSRMSDVPIAHRIPSELLDNIAQEAFASGVSQIEERRTMAAFISVNRRWAQLCRPVLWQVVYVTSETQHREFCILLETSPPASMVRIQDLIYLLFYSFTHVNGVPSWFHRSHNALITKLSSPRRLVFLEICQDSSTHPIRSLFSSLPRTLQSTHLSVHGLRFQDTRFESRAALLRLLAAAPQVASLLCNNVSWASDAPPPRSLVLSSKLECIAIEVAHKYDRPVYLGVEDVCWWLPPLIGHHNRPTSRDARMLWQTCSLRDSDLALITSTILCSLMNLRARRVSIQCYEHPTKRGLHTVWLDIKRYPHREVNDVYITIFYATPSAIAAWNLVDPGSPTPINIYKVHFYFLDSSLNCGWTLRDWEQILAYLSRLSSLEELIVQFKHRAVMRYFVNKYGSVSTPAALTNKTLISCDHNEEWESFRDLYRLGRMAEVES